MTYLMDRLRFIPAAINRYRMKHREPDFQSKAQNEPTRGNDSENRGRNVQYFCEIPIASAGQYSRRSSDVIPDRAGISRRFLNPTHAPPIGYDSLPCEDRAGALRISCLALKLIANATLLIRLR
jgi:hypothetical protein